MAKTFTLKFTAKYWKRHTCPVCGCVYRYKLIRDRQAQAQSEQAVEKAAANMIESIIKYDTEKHYCPTCGTQPVAVLAAQRRNAFLIATWVGILGVAVAWILGAAVGASVVTSVPWLACIIGIAATVPAFLSLTDANQDRRTTASRPTPTSRPAS